MSNQGMIGPQIPPGRNMGMDPSVNNQPLQFNQNKGKPPMPIVMDGGDRNDGAGNSTLPNQGGNNSNMMMGGPGFYGPMGGMGYGGSNMMPQGNMIPGNNGNMQGGNMMPGPMMGTDPNMMMMFNQYGGWGPMGPSGPGIGGPGMGPMPSGPVLDLMQKEIITLKCAVLYPPPPGAPPPTTRERPPGCRTVFVGGLPENATEEMISEVFENFGGIVSIRKGKKNFAHIRYETEDCVDRALFLSGYRMKLEDKDDKPNTGRLHVDYAQARDDQYEYECKQRAYIREMRHVQQLEQDRLRPPSPPPVVHYSDHESMALLEKLKSDDDSQKGNHVLITWLDRGDLTRRNVATFYSLIQCTNSQVRRLLGEKQQYEEEVLRAKEKFRQGFEGILHQFDQIEKVFSSSLKQKNWDHFSKAQRKNIELWHKQLQEIKHQQTEEFLNERVEDEMEMSDNEEVGDSNKKRKHEDSAAILVQQDFSQISMLRDENDMLKCQVEAFKNEIDLIRQENKNSNNDKESQTKMLQQVLQGMQQQLIQARQQVQELEKYKVKYKEAEQKATEKSEKEKKDDDKEESASKEGEEASKTEEESTGNTSQKEPSISDIPGLNFSTVSSTGLTVTEKEAKLIGLVSCFLHVHPNGASVDYIWSYLSQLGLHTRTSELEDLLERLPMLFKRELSGVGASIERKWQFLGYKTAPGAVMAFM